MLSKYTHACLHTHTHRKQQRRRREGRGWVLLGSCFLNLCDSPASLLRSPRQLLVCCTMSSRAPTTAWVKTAFTGNGKDRKEISAFYVETLWLVTKAEDKLQEWGEGRERKERQSLGDSEDSLKSINRQLRSELVICNQGRNHSHSVNGHKSYCLWSGQYFTQKLLPQIVIWLLAGLCETNWQSLARSW